MAISWIGKTTAIRQFVAAVKAAATGPVDASQGSLTLAIAQGVTGAFLWLQSFAIQVLSLTRAATSAGSDLDSWMADYFFTRLPAQAATGAVTFSRFTTSTQAVVPIGQLISTGPGGQQFIVTTDTTNPAYNAGLAGYVLAIGVASVTVPIAAVVAGAAGNAIAGTITSFVSPVTGVDTVTNALALVNGANAESDSAFRARFKLYIQSLREGTVPAIKSAILNIQQGLIVAILENQLLNLTTDNGYLTILVDDGSGSPPASLITAAANAADAARSAGIRFGVSAPTKVTATISLTVVSINSALHAADTAAAAAAITAYVNSLAIGATLVWARLYQLAFDSSSNISGVTGILLNAGTMDVTATVVQVIRTGTVTVS